MSASLVGSEMCIRDRIQPQNAPLGGAMRIAVPPWVGPGINRGEQGRPVSYTHLTLPTICSV
eukprot:6545243-Alexandrium_andersonii.AAC.1